MSAGRVQEAFILSTDKNHQEKERLKRGRKAGGFPRRTGDKAEPEQKDIEKHHPQHSDFGGHMLCHYGPFPSVTGQQHFTGQPSADGPAVGKDGGGQHPHAGGPHDDHCRRRAGAPGR